jgi:hypothetical protein
MLENTETKISMPVAMVELLRRRLLELDLLKTNNKILTEKVESLESDLLDTSSALFSARTILKARNNRATRAVEYLAFAVLTGLAIGYAIGREDGIEVGKSMKSLSEWTWACPVEPEKGLFLGIFDKPQPSITLNNLQQSQ